jgi:hypothetical protein
MTASRTMRDSKTKPNAQEAFELVKKSGGQPIGSGMAFVCPYPNCGVYAQHYWGLVTNLATYDGAQTFGARSPAKPPVTLAKCEACGMESVFVYGRLVWPRLVAAPTPATDLPESLKADFEEARQIHALSPRGAAALLRLVLQKLLPLIGAKKTKINDAIAELVAAGTINPSLQQALDTVRVIGNEAVHPGTIDLKDDESTVTILFNLINFIVHKAITEPKEVAAIYGGLPPDKLAGIARRDASKP